MIPDDRRVELVPGLNSRLVRRAGCQCTARSQGGSKSAKTHTYPTNLQSLREIHPSIFRTIFERSSSQNLVTRYHFPTYVNFVGQKPGVRALEQGECGALGALHHQPFDFFRWPIFFPIENGKRSKSAAFALLQGTNPGDLALKNRHRCGTLPIREFYG